MTNHPLVTGIPAVQAALDDEVKLEAARQAHRQRIEAAFAPHHAAVADWEQERRAALLAGKEPPPRPAEPDVGDVSEAEHLFVAEHARLRNQTRQAIADAAPEIEARFAEWEADWLRRASKPVGEVQRLTDEMTQALAGLREVRAVVDGSNPNARPRAGTGLAERTRQSIDAATVVIAVGRRDSLLAPEPLTLVGQAVAEHTGYRLSPGSPFGTPPDMRPPRRDGVARI